MQKGGIEITIYLENAIVDNMIINTLLLYFVFRTIKEQPKWRRIVLAAGVGTVAAIALPLLSYTGIAAFLIRLFVGAMMVFIVQNKNLTRFTLFYLLFLGYTFALGGAIYGLLFMFHSTAGSLLYFTYATSIPMGVFVLTAVAGLYLINLLIKYLNLRQSVNNHLQDLVIYNDGEKFKVLSYMDTGNRLVDPESRAPVVIITLSLFLKMFPEVTVDRVFLNKLNVKGGYYIDFSTVGNSGKMYTFAPEKIEINKSKTVENVRLGVSMRGFKDAIKYDALLNANLI